MTIRLSPILENSGHAAAIKDILERLLIEYETKAQEAVVGREAAALLNQLGGDPVRCRAGCRTSWQRSAGTMIGRSLSLEPNYER